MDAPLKGLAAAEALHLHFRLGAADARFDARAVARAVRSRVGRRRVSAALTRALTAVGLPTQAGRAPRSRERRRGAQRLVAATASPGRPAVTPGEGA